MIFYESDNLDNLFYGIEEIIGTPIEHIVIESKRREVKEYVEKLLPTLARKAARYMGMGMMIRKLSKIGKAYGYGNVKMAEKRIRLGDDDYVTMIVDNPHSILFFCGETLGAWEAIDGRESRVKYEEITTNAYEVTNYIGQHAIELKEHLQAHQYTYKAGDIRFDRCPRCGIPLDVARCKWNPELGTITDPDSGRRMAIFGPSGFEAILDDLEAELGAAIPEAVIEAQKRYTRKMLAGQDLSGGQEAFQRMLSLRGLGNMVSLELGEDRMSTTIGNSCLVLLMVGLIQGVFELIYSQEDSGHEWVVKDGGDLTITVYRR
jgi:hypothetical protein